MIHDLDQLMLDRAAAAAWRAVGLVEPGVPVGCVIARGDQVVAIGHHRRFGDLHAEREALRAAEQLGRDVRGATMYVTLEPCRHQGKQPPCTDAIAAAGIGEVVYARHDPGEASGGGAAELEAAGVACRHSEASAAAAMLSDPFVKRSRTSMPWVIAKWAQTVDGRVATRTGQSQWISSDRSRRRVHKLRERVDAIITGLGTARFDDPLLTARVGRPPRRIARRVVIDTDLDLPADSKLAMTAQDTPVTVCCANELKNSEYLRSRREALEERGVEVIGVRSDSRRLDLDIMLKQLADQHGVTNAMLECGPGLMGSFFEMDLVDEAVVYVAPLLLADELAMAAASGRTVPSLSGGRNFRLTRVKRLGDDVELTYRRPL
ncbi:MAG: bifunctional diaminohydroxyphosphoribosylaminopyrimidine deaminase/5-amino-6-(5-phosphoribosylamino)uracil reductase RibD [Planctomycetota bacterium]